MKESSPKAALKSVTIAHNLVLTPTHLEALRKLHGKVTTSHFPCLEERVPSLEQAVSNLYVYTDSAVTCSLCFLRASPLNIATFGFFEQDEDGSLTVYQWEEGRFVQKLKLGGQENLKIQEAGG